MIIIVGHEKGGVGKSQIAFNLASLFSDLNTNVILVDTDPQGTTRDWGRIRSAMGHPERFPLVEKTSHPGALVAELSTKYEVVIVDLAGGDYERFHDLARIADLWVAPMQVGQGDFNSTVNLDLAFAKLGSRHIRGSIPLAVVINCAPTAGNSLEAQDAIEALRSRLTVGTVFNSILRERKVYRDAHRTGRSIFEMPTRDSDKAVNEFNAFFNELMEMHASLSEPKSEGTGGKNVK